MLDLSAAALGPLACILLGMLLLFGTAGAGRSGSQAGEVLVVLLRVAGWLLLLIGMLMALAITSQALGLLLWLVVLVVLVMGVTQYLTAERQSLLWMLTVAAERGIPLESAARAFGQERNDRVGSSALLLADYLEAGVPLSLALQRSGCRLPQEALLAADLGQESGQLGVALRRVVGQLDESETTLRCMLERLFYLGFLVLFASAVLLFILVRIIPIFAQMMRELDVRLPAVTNWLLDLSSGGSFFLVPISLLVAVLGCCAIVWYVGFVPRNLPLVGRLWWSSDCAFVMRWLAMAVRQRRPLAEVIRGLAVRFPQPAIRRRLERASRRIDRGSNWSDSLRQAGVISQSESNLFQTAERVGNLDWTLEEMADRRVRRAVYRMRAWLDIAFPVAIAMLGAVVLVIALGVLLPLITLIQGLA